MPSIIRMNDFNLTPGKAYLLKTSILAAPHNPTGMIGNPRIPIGTMFISWPNLDDSKLSATITTDERAKLDGRLYDFAIWNDAVPVGCHRFYRVAAEQLEGAAEEIVSR